MRGISHVRAVATFVAGTQVYADGTLEKPWGMPGKTAPGKFHVPHGVWVHTDGHVLVADRENNRIQTFSPEGGF